MNRTIIILCFFSLILLYLVFGAIINHTKKIKNKLDKQFTLGFIVLVLGIVLLLYSLSGTYNNKGIRYNSNAPHYFTRENEEYEFIDDADVLIKCDTNEKISTENAFIDIDGYLVFYDKSKLSPTKIDGVYIDKDGNKCCEIDRTYLDFSGKPILTY